MDNGPFNDLRHRYNELVQCRMTLDEIHDDLHCKQDNAMKPEEAIKFWDSIKTMVDAAKIVRERELDLDTQIKAEWKKREDEQKMVARNNLDAEIYKAKELLASLEAKKAIGLFMTTENDDREPITLRPNKPPFQVTDIEIVVNPANLKWEDQLRMRTNIPQKKDYNGDVFVTFYANRPHGTGMKFAQDNFPDALLEYVYTSG